MVFLLSAIANFSIFIPTQSYIFISYFSWPKIRPWIFPLNLHTLYSIYKFGVIAMIITLNQVLEDKGISQNQLAKDTGISVETIRNFKNNKTTRISFDVLEKVCNRLGCGIEDLLYLEKDEWFFVGLDSKIANPCFGTGFVLVINLFYYLNFDHFNVFF